MVHCLLGEVANIRMASDTDIDGIRLRQARLPCGMGAVTVGAIPARPRVRNLGGLDELGLVIMARHTERLCVSLSQNHFAVLDRSMTEFARFLFEWRVLKLGHQLGSR